MLITKEDWLKDTVWRETHLTRKNWLKGSARTEKGRFEKGIEPPPDRIITIRHLQLIPSDPKEPMKDWSEIAWVGLNDFYLEEAQESWGVLPRRNPPLSANSARRYKDLKNITIMLRPSNERQLGKKIKPWSWQSYG